MKLISLRNVMHPKRLFWFLGLIEIITWFLLLRFVSLQLILLALFAPKLVFWIYLYWRWRVEIRFAWTRIEKVEKSAQNRTQILLTKKTGCGVNHFA